MTETDPIDDTLKLIEKYKDKDTNITSIIHNIGFLIECGCGEPYLDVIRISMNGKIDSCIYLMRSMKYKTNAIHNACLKSFAIQPVFSEYHYTRMNYLIDKYNVVKHIIDSVKMYATDSELVSNGYKALQHIIFNNYDKNQGNKLKKKIVSYNGIKVIITSMNNFKTDQAIQENGVKLLSLISRKMTYCNKIGGRINKDIQVDSDEKFICTWVTIIHRNKLADLGGIDRINDAMDLYKANNDIQKYGKEFLDNMKDYIKPKVPLEASKVTKDKEVSKEPKDPNGSNGPNGPPNKKQKTSPQAIPENSLLIHFVDGKYISTEGVEFVPSMKALCNTQEEVAKVVVKKEDDI